MPNCIVLHHTDASENHESKAETRPAGQILPPMGRWRDAVSPVRADGEVWVRSIGETASG